MHQFQIWNSGLLQSQAMCIEWRLVSDGGFVARGKVNRNNEDGKTRYLHSVWRVSQVKIYNDVRLWVLCRFGKQHEYSEYFRIALEEFLNDFRN